MSVNFLKLHEMQTAMNALAVEEAEKSGKKITAGIRAVADAVGVDYATMKGFVFGTIKKPSGRTVDRVRTFLRDNGDCESVVEDPRDAKIDALLNEMAALEQTIKHKDKDREQLRLQFVEMQSKMEGIESADPAHAEKYQVVHPENSWWMQNSEAYIKIFTHNDSCEGKKRLCTIPIPSLVESMPTVEGESHEEWKMRLGQITEEHKHLVMKLADQIADLYETCRFPDEYIGVDVVTSRLHIG